jgi:zinc and cadmium transporter
MSFYKQNWPVAGVEYAGTAMILVAIIIGTLLAGVGSVWLAALLSLGVLARYGAHLLSLAAGALMATVFMHLLPEAFESSASAYTLSMVFLAALVFFFLLDKAELYHHGHEHHHAHDHAHQHTHQHHGGSWSVLLGDSVHAFGDGVLIAGAFIADWHLGLAATLAVLTHEVPHHMGDLVVLRHNQTNSAAASSRAIALLSLTGLATLLGGLVGYGLLGRDHALLPYLLVVACASFVYVALADLIPQLQKRLSLRETAAQVVWLLVGIALVTAATQLKHAH